MRKIRNILFVLPIFIFIIISGGFAQGFGNEIKQIVDSNLTDSTKFQLLLKHAQSSDFKDREQSIKYYSEAIKFTDDNYNIATLKDTIGLYNWQMGNLKEALVAFNSALTLFEELQDSAWLGKVYNNIAVVNYGLGNRNEALLFYHKGLTIREALNDKDGISRILNNIGMIYQDWGLYDRAMSWHNNALEVSKEINDNDRISYSYANIGSCYEHLNQYDNALKNYLLGANYIQINDERNRSNSFFSAFIGSVYEKMNMLDSALYHNTKALDYANRIYNKSRIALAQYNLSRTYLIRNNLKQAILYNNLSYQLSLQQNYTDLIKDNLFLMAEIEETNGNIPKSYEYFKQASVLKDSLFNTEQVKQFTDLQIKYYTEKQEQENVLLKQNSLIQESKLHEQKLINRGLIIAGILILLLLAIIARSRRSFKKLSLKLEKSEKELILANANKDKFFTIIAHDLKSPFNGLMGIAEILSNELADVPNERAKKLIQMLNDSSGNVYALLESLLHWAQIQTGKINYEFVKTDLFQISTKVVDLLAINAGNKEITIQNNIPENTLFAYADEKAVSTVLRNLISNAIKFTYPGGKILIDAEESDNNVMVLVTDNGIGMEAHQIKQIFEITEKRSKQGTAQETGTGLGLILCKELLEKNNGSIRVKSNPGEGSTFSFTLPKNK